jgi:predicted RNA-binding protein with PUA-like domain
MKRYWLMKSEPSEFSINDLEQKGTALWDGIRNYQVRNMIRDEMRVGDKALFYHSSCVAIGVVGEMEVAGPAVPDKTQFDPKSKYYDTSASQNAPRWLAFPVKHIRTYANLVPLADIKADRTLSGLTILKPGNRLSITEITKNEYGIIAKLGT